MRNALPLATLLLAACSANPPLPRVDDGALALWIYQCREGRVSAEYANMGGQYSATLAYSENGGKQRKVLLREHAHHFTLDTLHWSSPDGKTYTLTQNGAPLFSACRSAGPAPDDGEAGTVRLQLDRIFQ